MRRGISSLKSLGFVKKPTISNKIFSIALRFHSNSPPSLLENYKNLVEQGKVQHDPYQERVAFELEKLLSRLQQYEKDMEDYYVKLAEWEEKREEERLKLLVKEAKEKQETGGGGIWTTVNKQRNRILEKFAIFG
jgi:predicted ATPase